MSKLTEIVSQSVSLSGILIPIKHRRVYPLSLHTYKPPNSPRLVPDLPYITNYDTRFFTRGMPAAADTDFSSPV